MDLFPGEPAFPDQELRKPPAHGEYPFTLPVLLQLSRRPAFQRLLRHLIILAVPIAHRIFLLQPQNRGNGKVLIEIGCQMRSRRPAAKLKHRHFFVCPVPMSPRSISPRQPQPVPQDRPGVQSLLPLQSPEYFAVQRIRKCQILHLQIRLHGLSQGPGRSGPGSLFIFVPQAYIQYFRHNHLFLSAYSAICVHPSVMS